ncbi:MAG: superoxide dismutase [Candidatus Doudnabacteria bacterium]|nr:superoxide dismutase [Candidatus Doudnabacteria bacterium]
MFQIDPLPYDVAALEPHIDAQTMEIHHDKHHAKYAENLNKALEAFPDWQSQDLETLLGSLDRLPEEIRTTVRNNAGGVWNHNHFWSVMAAQAGGQPSGELATAIDTKFGSFAEFQKQFTETATKLFGSGWAWLAKDPQTGELHLHALPNQDNPLMYGHIPVLGLDVWEHAYYLKYHNKRPDYIAAWWNVVNWAGVGKIFETSK